MGGYTPATEDVSASDLADARARIRTGEHTGPTSGLAPGFAQANLVDSARRRRARLPALLRPEPEAVPAPRGHRHRLADIRPRFRRDADLRTDLPRYRVFRDGALVDEPTDVTRYWRDDLVSFLLGCSFTFEWALAAAGLPLAHQQQGVNVPMYVTDRRCIGAGPFRVRWSCR